MVNMVKKIIKSIKKTNYIKSFKKLNTRFLLCVGVDAGYYLAMFALFTIAILSLAKTMAHLPKLIPLLVEMQQGAAAVPGEGGTEMLIASAMQARSILLTVFAKIGIGVLAFFLVVIGVTSAAKGLIWRIVSKKRFHIKLFLRLFLFNIIAFLLYSLIIIAVSMVFKVKIAAYIIIFLSTGFVYFKIMAYPNFMRKEKIGKAVKETLRMGVKKAHILIGIYVVIILTAFFPLAAIRLLNAVIKNEWIILIAIGLFLMIYAGWARFYLYDVVEQAGKK